ncbi:MAG: twin-arginine translocase TatA/TatE family subunit [Candidatus Thermoplasmatota archaeon]|nr:twin-arginine translocase TatA/TatE family subunit [Candidatus Thermoplasmatota archaeon]
MVLGLGTWEMLLVAAALLVFFGPEHLPRAMHTLGKWQGRLRGMLKEMEETIEKETRGPVTYPELEPSETGEIPKERE